MRKFLVPALAAAIAAAGSPAAAQRDVLRPSDGAPLLPPQRLQVAEGVIPAAPTKVRCTDVTDIYAAGGIFSENELALTCVPQAGGSMRLRIAQWADYTVKEPVGIDVIKARSRAQITLFASIVGTFATLRAAGKPVVLDLDLQASKVSDSIVFTSVRIR